jgi:hypothetical protein
VAIDLQEILKHHQASLLADLDMARSVFANAEAKGDATEFEWLKVIDEFLPNRYLCSAAFVLDSNGDVSEFIDIVIHDRHFCPLLFEQGGQKYIPAESVYAVLETKQKIDKGNIEYAAGKGASVRRLHRTQPDSACWRDLRAAPAVPNHHRHPRDRKRLESAVRRRVQRGHHRHQRRAGEGRHRLRTAPRLVRCHLDGRGPSQGHRQQGRHLADVLPHAPLRAPPGTRHRPGDRPNRLWPLAGGVSSADIDDRSFA